MIQTRNVVLLEETVATASFDTKDDLFNVEHLIEGNFFIKVVDATGVGDDATLSANLITYNPIVDEWDVLSTFTPMTGTDGGTEMKSIAGNLGPSVAIEGFIEGSNPSFTIKVGASLKG